MTKSGCTTRRHRLILHFFSLSYYFRFITSYSIVFYSVGIFFRFSPAVPQITIVTITPCRCCQSFRMHYRIILCKSCFSIIPSVVRHCDARNERKKGPHRKTCTYFKTTLTFLVRKPYNFGVELEKNRQNIGILTSNSIGTLVQVVTQTLFHSLLLLFSSSQLHPEQWTHSVCLWVWPVFVFDCGWQKERIAK